MVVHGCKSRTLNAVRLLSHLTENLSHVFRLQIEGSFFLLREGSQQYSWNFQCQWVSLLDFQFGHETVEP
jgi:hypothetical protein